MATNRAVIVTIENNTVRSKTRKLNFDKKPQRHSEHGDTRRLCIVIDVAPHFGMSYIHTVLNKKPRPTLGEAGFYLFCLLCFINNDDLNHNHDHVVLFCCSLNTTFLFPADVVLLKNGSLSSFHYVS